MLSIIKELLPIFKYTSAAVSNSSNFRAGFVFDEKDELTMASPDAIRKDLGLKEEDNAKLPVLSSAELHIKKLNKKLPGLGLVADVLFSPNTLKILGLLGAATLVFSPLGPYVAAAGIALTVGVLAVNTFLEVRAVKARQEGQVKNGILKESVKELEKLQAKQKSLDTFPSHPNLLTALLKETNHSADKMQANVDKHGQQKEAQHNAIKAAMWGIGLRMPTMVFSLTVAIVTLNPISISLAALSFALGGASGGIQAERNARTGTEFSNKMTGMRNQLGLENIPGHKGAVDHAEALSDLKRTNRALDRFQAHYKDNCEILNKAGLLTEQNLVKLFKEEYYDKEPKVKLEPPKITYLSATKDVVLNGFTWSAAKTAVCPENPKYDRYVNDNAYHKGLENQHTLDKEQNLDRTPRLDRFVEKNKPVTKNLENHHFEDMVHPSPTPTNPNFSRPSVSQAR